MTQVVVIGSGFAGLATALRLQARGYAVTILEKRAKPGGRAYQLKDGGYTFDLGPSIITAPDLVDGVFAATGVKTADYVDIVPLEPFYRIFFADGRHYDYSGDQATIERELTKFEAGAPDSYARFMEKTGDIYRRAFADLAHKPFLSVGDFARLVPELAKLRADRSVYQLVTDYFTDPSLRMAYSFHPLFIGGNPFRASAIYSIVPFLERKGGVHFAMGGMYALIEAFVRRFLELGGTLHCGVEVAEIEVAAASPQSQSNGRSGARMLGLPDLSGVPGLSSLPGLSGNRNGGHVRGRVRGVRASDGRRWDASVVVSNADVVMTYAKLLRPRHRRRWTDRRIGSLNQSMSCFLLYLGIDRQYDQLLHHTIIMSARYRGLIEDIFDTKILADDFSLYLHAPAKTDPSLAPPGGEALYVLAPVPNLAGATDWHTQATPFRDRLVRWLEEDFGLTGLRASIKVEHRFTPLDFKGELNAFLGNAFSIEPTLTQSAYFRPHNRSEDVDGLYIAGAGTHPGAGLPGTLLSAEIADRLVAADVPIDARPAPLTPAVPTR